MTRRQRKQSRHIKPIVLIFILLIALAIVGVKGYEVYQSMAYPDLIYELKDTQQFNVYDDIKVESLVKSVGNGEIINGSDLLDTSSVGIQSADISFKNLKDEVTTITVKYEVLDTEAPVISVLDTITAYVNTDLDLYDYINVEDNYDDEVGITIEGDYDTDVVGEYDLIVYANDKSDNTSSKSFKLNVMKKNEPIDYTNNYSESLLVDGTYITSKGYTLEVIDHIAYINGIMIANKSYNLPSTYTPGFLTVTANAFEEMKNAAAELGLNLYNSSGYRSYTYQKQLYNNYCKRDGQVAADTYSARPGHSEHQTGYALDLNTITNAFKNTEEGKWVAAHCYEYGFILRYPEGKENETGYMYEPWHIRYVGVELATELYNDGDWITLEDYFGIDSVYSE